MARRLSDAEREQRRQENVEKVLRGRPNRYGRLGDERAWRGIGESVLMEKTGRTGDPDMDLFGLATGFTLDMLKKAYRKMMREVHPDLGGTVQQAQAANAAFERLRARHVG